MKKINLNEVIKVRLTPKGQEIYMDSFRDVNRYFHKEILEVKPREIDENGLSEFQIWHFMNLFGQYFYNGRVNPVIFPLEFYINDEDLVDISEGAEHESHN